MGGRRERRPRLGEWRWLRCDVRAWEERPTPAGLELETDPRRGIGQTLARRVVETLEVKARWSFANVDLLGGLAEPGAGHVAV